MRIALAALALCVLSAVASSVGAQELVVKGAVAYTDILRYDYKGDGKRSPVRFWMEFDARSAKGQPGTPGYQPASGSMRYFLRDEDDGTKVMKWRHGLDMEGAPKDVPVPMSDIEFDNKTAKFEAFGMRWTITDGGDDYRSDRITVNDGFRTSTITKLYAGDLWVGPPK
jgi:hypothetical protein